MVVVYEKKGDTDTGGCQDMAVQLGATLVDGFEVSSIREEGGVVTVTGADNVAYSAPSLGDVFLHYTCQTMSTCTSSVSWTLGQ